MVAFSLIGPLPIPGLNPSLPLILTAVSFRGGGSVLLFIGTFNSLINQGKEYSTEEVATVTGLMTSAWETVRGSGQFLSPFLCGILLDKIGYRWESAALAAIHLMVMVLVLGHTLSSRCLSDQERQPLINGNR